MVWPFEDTANPEVADRSVRALLDAAAEADSQAMVLLPPATVTLPARFRAVSADTVTLQLFGEPDGPVAEGMVAMVQFRQGHRVRAFLAPVMTAGESAGRLTLGLPSDVARMDQRRAFRVPVPPSTLRAVVVVGDVQYAGWVADLSCFGARVDLPSTAERNAAVVVGQRAVVAFGDDEALVMQGRVVRRSGALCGIAFTPGADGAPEPRLASLVAEVERSWLREQRAHKRVADREPS